MTEIIILDEEVSKAVSVIKEKLRKDEGYFDSWKSAIAHAFYEEGISGEFAGYIASEDLGVISDNASERFLKTFLS